MTPGARMAVGARIALAVCGLAALAILVLGGASAGARGGVTIKLGDDFFDPASAKIAKGTKVRFKWTGADEHNMIKKKGPGGDFSSPRTDERGVNFKHRFRKRGTYRIVCTIHDEMKLKLRVE